MQFTKMQGAGNDFVMAEASNIERDWSRAAIAMCDRHYGIGADGLVLVLPSDIADIRMRIFNADGSEAEACGNGLRCLSRYAMEKGLVSTRAREITVETAAGIRKVIFSREDGRIIKIQADMGKPIFAPQDIPVLLETDKGKQLDIIFDYPVTVDGWELTLDFVSMGNPHAVYFWQQPVADFPLEKLGPEIEHHRLFPKRTNFEVARVISRKEIEARFWERGAGETLACGSGACAIAVAARLRGYTDSIVDIKLPGGILGVEWNGRDEVFLSGPAEIVFTGEWHESEVAE